MTDTDSWPYAALIAETENAAHVRPVQLAKDLGAALKEQVASNDELARLLNAAVLYLDERFPAWDADARAALAKWKEQK